MTAESTQMKKFTLNDLQKHSTRDDCWIVVHQKVWDITSFIDEHPGGPAGKTPPLRVSNDLILMLY